MGRFLRLCIIFCLPLEVVQCHPWPTGVAGAPLVVCIACRQGVGFILFCLFSAPGHPVPPLGVGCELPLVELVSSPSRKDVICGPRVLLVFFC